MHVGAAQPVSLLMSLAPDLGGVGDLVQRRGTTCGRDAGSRSCERPAGLQNAFVSNKGLSSTPGLGYSDTASGGGVYMAAVSVMIKVSPLVYMCRRWSRIITPTALRVVLCF